MKTYHLRPQTVQAIQWTGNNLSDFLTHFPVVCKSVNNTLVVTTVDGDVQPKLYWYVGRDTSNGFISVYSSSMFNELMVP